jgi:hypothetical protein
VVEMSSERMRGEVILKSAGGPLLGSAPTRDVANQSCLKLAAPRAFMSPDRELA